MEADGIAATTDAGAIRGAGGGGPVTATDFARMAGGGERAGWTDVRFAATGSVAAADQLVVWGGQSWLQPPFRRLLAWPQHCSLNAPDSKRTGEESRLKAGCSHDWLPHKAGRSQPDRSGTQPRIRI